MPCRAVFAQVMPEDEDEDGGKRDFWEEVHAEAHALMRDQLEEAREAARQAGVEAAQAEIEVSSANAPPWSLLLRVQPVAGLGGRIGL